MNLIKEISKISVYSLYKKNQSNKIKKAGLAIIQNYLKDNKERKLHIGSGGFILEGWLNVDLEPLDRKIAYLDAGTDYPLPDHSIDYVFSEHLFEHLNLDQQIKMLDEIARILKPGGKARIATPNLDAILGIRSNPSDLVKEYIGWAADTYFPQHIAKLGDSVKDPAFVINNYFYSWGHQFIHNPSSFTLLARKAGFENIVQVKIRESSDPALKGLETHDNVIPTPYNELETMVFEINSRKQL